MSRRRPATEFSLAARTGSEYRLASAGVYETSRLPGAVALLDGAFAGAVTWSRDADLLRIVTLASASPGRGVGRALLAAAEAEAAARRRRGRACDRSSSTRRARYLLSRSGGCQRNATGDRGPAPRPRSTRTRGPSAYQRNGYRLTALHPGAIDGFRRLKPSIPLVDSAGIPLRDMIELEKPLG